LKSCSFKTDGITAQKNLSAIHTILIAVVWILATAAIGALAQRAPAAMPETGYRIAGTVVNALTGEPVQRATVAAQSEADRKTVASVVTDNEGRFTLEGLAAAKYPLTASRRGFRTAFYDEHDEGFNTAIVTGEGQNTGSLVFRLSPGAAIHGVISGDGGDPVEGAQVMLFAKPHNNNPGARIVQAGIATSDDTGAYEFDNLPPGEFLLAVKAEPWYALHHSVGSRQRAENDPSAALDVAYPVTLFDSTTDESSATKIILAAGSREEANVNLHAVPALHLTIELPVSEGPVVNTELRQSIFGAEVFSTGLRAPIWNGSSAWENDFAGIAPGHYQLTQGTPPRIVELDATTSQQVDPSLGTPTVTVSGSLRATSGFVFPEDLQVILSPLDGAQSQAPLQANCVKGSFTIDAVPPGIWKLTAFSPGKTLSIRSIFVGGQMHAGNALTVRDKPVQVEALVSLGDTRVEGFARQSRAGKNGKGIAGVMVVLVPRNPAANGDQFRRDQSDSDGSFSLNDVAPGEYTAVAIEDGWELDWARPEVIERYLPKGIAVTVTESSGKLVRISEGVPVQSR
jgi:hypothetical protein